MDAYHVHMTVDLQPDHPKFYDLEDGILCVCVWAKDERHAADMADLIVDVLPYQVRKGGVTVLCGPAANLSLCRDLENCARSFGVGLGLVGREIGESWDPPTSPG